MSAVVLAALLTMALAATASAHIQSKTIDTTTGECSIPESPLSILLLATGGIGAAWFVAGRMRLASNNTLAS